MLRIFEDQKFASQTFSRLGIARTSSALHSAYRKRSPIFYAPSPRPPFIRNRSLTQSFSLLGRTRISSALHLAYRKCSCRGFLLTHVYYIEMQFAAAPLRRTQLARGSFRPPPSANIWLTRVNYIYKCSSQNCAGRSLGARRPAIVRECSHASHRRLRPEYRCTFHKTGVTPARSPPPPHHDGLQLARKFAQPSAVGEQQDIRIFKWDYLFFVAAWDNSARDKK